jgi:hypothetical protein
MIILFTENLSTKLNLVFETSNNLRHTNEKSIESRKDEMNE